MTRDLSGRVYLSLFIYFAETIHWRPELWKYSTGFAWFQNKALITTAVVLDIYIYFNPDNQNTVYII